MARKYEHIQIHEEEIKEMKKAGKTNREIAEEYGYKDKYVVKRLISRINQRERREAEGILSKRRGRPAKGNESKEEEIERLKMENELLRDFLRNGGRE